MISFLSRRSLLSAASVGALAFLLVACNDKKEEAPVAPKAESPATEPVKPAADVAKAEAPASVEPAKPAAETGAQAAEAPKADAPAKAVDVPEPEGEYDAAKVLEQGPLKDLFIGNADAKVTIVEYASMTCSHCAHFHEGTLPAIKAKYIDTGKVRFALREFPFDPRAAAAFMLARCAGDDKREAMVSTLFKQQAVWAGAEDAEAALLQLSKLAGFTQDSFKACLTNQQLLTDVNATRERGAKDFGINATPTFLINGKKYPGALTVEQLSGIIDSML